MLEEVAKCLEQVRSPLSVASTLGFENHPALRDIRSSMKHSTLAHSDVERIVYHCDAASQYMSQTTATKKQTDAKKRDDKTRNALSHKQERKMRSMESALQNFALDHFRYVSDPTKIYSWSVVDAPGPGAANVSLHSLNEYLTTPLGVECNKFS
eukprot:3681495-Pyramimonas_sp.AAC.1